MRAEEMQELEESIEKIWIIAEKFGLDPFPVHFEVVPATIMYEFGAYGLPGRFSHWSHGKAYHQMKTRYDYGLSKIYELVINTNPSYAFLMENNSVLQNKLVAAHVLAHSDFFKHNMYYSHTSRRMVDIASTNAERIRKYEFEHGKVEVEKFIDAALSIQEHIDPNVRFKKKSYEEVERELRSGKTVKTPYDDLFFRELSEPREEAPHPHKIPPEPEKDMLFFIMEHSPNLEEWQRDVVGIIRVESYYFLPQMQTKVMNEGWASYWHARIMRDLDMTTAEHVEFATLHSGVLATSRRNVNPYTVGMKMFEDIERRWDSPTEEERQRFGRRGGEGKAKIFDVRETENDISFLRNYLTKELVEDLDLYLYRLEGDQWVIVEKDWEKVRDSLVASMTNFGNPVIMVEDGDYRGNRELYMRHSFEGQELDLDYADRTLRYVYQLWGRPVHLETVITDHPVLLSFDGKECVTSRL